MNIFIFILILIAVWLLRRIISRLLRQSEEAVDTAITASEIALAEQRNALFAKAKELKEYHTLSEINDLLNSKRVK